MIVCCVAIVSACSSDPKYTLPEGILTVDEMIEVITDMQILDAAQKSLPISGLKQKAMKDTTYAIIYAHHNISHELFDSSLRSYTRHPQLMGEIMEKVAEEINAKN